MKYNEFSRLLAAVKDLVKATGLIFERVDSPDELPEDLYYFIIKLHNSAIDYIEAINELKKKEENQNGRICKRQEEH